MNFRKRLLVILLLMGMVLLTGCGTNAGGNKAEETAPKFTLHSGVEFGMTAEEAILTAEMAGNTFVLNEDGRLTNTNKITLADYPVEVYFDLDENGRVSRQQYVLSYSLSVPKMGEKGAVDAEELSAALVKTYGPVMGGYGQETVLPLPKVMAGPVAPSITYVGEEIPFKYYSLYHQWLVPSENDYVAIELYQFHYMFRMTIDVGTKTYIDYTPYTKEEIAAAAAGAEQAAQEEAEEYYSGF